MKVHLLAHDQKTVLLETEVPADDFGPIPNIITWNGFYFYGPNAQFGTGCPTYTQKQGYTVTQKA